MYHEFKTFGSGRITGKAISLQLAADEHSLSIRTPQIDDYPNPVENERTKELLDLVWHAYGKLSAIQLSNLTHQAGTPWSETVEKNPDKRGVDIPDEIMRNWFAERTVTPA